MRRHPLTDVVGSIQPARVYTVDDVAGLCGVSRTTAARWAAGGHLGQGTTVPVGRHDSFYRREWTGGELQAAARAPRPVQYHPGAKPTTTYGRGCRAGDGCSCAEHHAADTTAAKRRKAEAAFPPPVRQQLLADVAAGSALDAALRRIGVSHQRLWVWARILEDFGRALDEALTVGRDPGISHGSEHSYRVHACRCPDCRAAKARYRIPAQPVGASR